MLGGCVGQRLVPSDFGADSPHSGRPQVGGDVLEALRAKPEDAGVATLVNCQVPGEESLPPCVNGSQDVLGVSHEL